jgi:uncharacterized protein YigE (DUF2233 family)
MRVLVPILALLAVAGPAASAPAPAEPEACVRRSFEGSRFTACLYTPGRDRIALAWRGRGAPLGSLGALRAFQGREARQVRFAMNAGMYDTEQAPLGLFVADGRTVRPARTESGTGNFYLKPNGIFFVDDQGRAAVAETGAFLASGRQPIWATQSGPLLVSGGVLHPAILPNGESRLIRNGVGVTAEGRAWFVISDDPVSFGRFARFFRDGLGTPDALYLDGTVSSAWIPAHGRLDGRGGLGPLVVVSRSSSGPGGPGR